MADLTQAKDELAANRKLQEFLLIQHGI